MPAEEVTHNFLADITIGQAIVATSTLLGVITILWRGAAFTKRMSNLMDDWFGEPPRPGVPARKGVMERLSDQDSALSKVDPIINVNHDGNHAEVLKRLDTITNQTKSNAQHMTHVERLLNRHIRESKAWLSEVEKRTAEVDFDVPPWPELPDDDEGKGT